MTTGKSNTHWLARLAKYATAYPSILSVTALMILTAFLYWPCVDTDVAGFLHDDGVYVATARALAEKHAYIIPYLPGMPAQVKYPILYPLLLMPAWLLQPHFPANLPLMHQITLTFAIAAIPLLYYYLRQVRDIGMGLALMILVLTFSQFHFIFYATALMSEAPYFFFSLLTLCVAEAETKSDRPERWSWRRDLGLALLSALTFHTRTIGLSLIVALFVWRLLRQQWKSAACYLFFSLCLTVIPWGWWIKTHAPARVDALNYPLAYVYGGYGLEYGVNTARNSSDFFIALLDKGLHPLMENLAALLFPMAPFALSHQPVLSECFTLALGGLFLALGVQAILQRKYSPSGLYLFFYLGALAVWMYPNQAPRFLSMLLPWLWLTVFRFFGSISLSPSVRFPSPKPFPQAEEGGEKPLIFKIVMPCVGLLLIGWLSLWPAIRGYELLNTMRSRHLLEPSGRYADLWPDYQALFTRIRANIPQNEPIAAIWDPAMHLYTDHPSFVLFASALQPIDGRVTRTSYARLCESLRHYKVRYVLSEPFMLNQEVKAPFNPLVENLKQYYPTRFQPVFVSPHGWLVLYQFKYEAFNQSFGTYTQSPAP